MKSSEFTICITNFARPEHLARCLESVKPLPNVVVASYGAGPEHRGIIESIRPGTRCHVTDKDYGENRLLLQAVALADTPWVVILHDDDQLTSDFAFALSQVNPGDAGFIAWDGVTEWYDGRPAKRISPWGKGPGGIQSSTRLLKDVTVPHGGMVRSPVTMMLRKDICMAVLSWCEEGLKEFHTRPTMMIGNEIALLFGHLKEHSTFYHIQKPLVKFGHWEGSETVKYVNGEVPELVQLYDGVRRKFGAEQFIFRQDRIFPIFVHAYTGGKPGPRQTLAQSTWIPEHMTVESSHLIVPLKIDESKLPRTSGNIGDTRKLPYLKDMFNACAGFCYGDKDIIHVTNDDLCMTTGSLVPMVARAAELGSTYAHRREFLKQDLASLGLDGLTRPLTPDEVVRGREHSGCDSVTFTRAWWRDIGLRHLPDFIIGCEAWDTIIIMLMRMSGSGWGWKNTTYHEYHESFWKAGTNHFGNPGQIHNRRLAKEYLVAHSIYRGEFEHGSKKDPAYPKRPPGCDTHPDTPVVKYMGDPEGFKPPVPARTPARVSAPVPPEKKEIRPVKVPESLIAEPPKRERAIVYPYNSLKAKWHELRYSLRSVEKFFEDKECEIHIYGTSMPGWLRKNKRVVWHDCWTYAEALIRGVQTAKEVLWMNDDTIFLKSVTWDDCRVARYLRPVREDWNKETNSPPNTWQQGVLRVLRELQHHGHEKLLLFCTHAPYVYRRDEALATLEKYGVWEKMPLELAYFHEHATDPQPIDGLLATGEDFGIAKFLNHNDSTLTPALKAKIEAMFPERAEWENTNS